MADLVNPFEWQQPQAPPPQWGGMPQTAITPQGERVPAEGSSFMLSPEAMRMLWAPHPQQQVQLPPLPPPQPQV